MLDLIKGQWITQELNRDASQPPKASKLVEDITQLSIKYEIPQCVHILLANTHDKMSNYVELEKCFIEK